jgi:tetratricopeptide (TPR) repeat protein
MKHQLRAPRTALLLAAALAAASGLLVAPAPAQTIGRVEVTVLDDTGTPIQGVQILVTSEQLTRFKENVKTDKRGRAAVSFVDATKEYLFHLEAEGFTTLEQYIRPTPMDTVRRELRMQRKTQSAGATPGSQPGEPEQPAASYTPAQLAFNEGVDNLRASASDPAQTKARLEAAVAQFEEALQKDPNLLEAWSALALAHAEREDWQAALDAAQRYAEKSAPNASIYRVLYRAHQALGNTEEAQQARTALSELGEGKDSAAFAHNEGVAAVRIGDDATALERFEEAVRLSPDLAPTHVAIAVIQLRHNRFQEAAAAAETALALNPENSTALMVRWQAYRALGDKDKEAAALAELAKRNPEPVVAELLNRAKTLFEGGDAKGAAAELERALALTPENAEAHYRLGLAYVSVDDKAKAKEHLERFLALAPDHPEAASAKEMISYLK